MAAAVLIDVAVGALGHLQQSGQDLLAPLEAGLEPHDVAVGLVLTEREVQQMVSLIARVGAHEVGGHVVRRPERGGEPEGSARGKPGDLVEGHERRPQHDRVAERVDASTSGATGELRVLPRRQELVALAGELRELLDDDRTRRHVDAEREGLGREDDLDEPFDEAGFDRLLERRDQARVMGSDAGLESRHPSGVAQHREVGVLETAKPGADDLTDAVALRCRRQSEAGVEARRRGIGARGSAEDEVDRGEHPLRLRAARRLRCDAACTAACVHGSVRGHCVRAASPSSRDASGFGRPSTSVGSRCSRSEERSPIRYRFCSSTGLRSSMIVAVGPRTVVIQSASSSALLTVADRHTSLADCGGVDDHLLPHRPAVRVLEVVHLVEDDVAEVAQCVGTRVDHVAQHLGRHHDDRSVTVDRVVAGEEPDALRSVAAHEVGVLLVRERLDRSRVERLGALRERMCDRVFRDEGLARRCRRGDEHRRPGVDRVDRGDLEVVEREAVAGEELGAKSRDVVRGHVAGAGALRVRCLSTSFPITIATS